jgi:hypothetical protein
VVIEVVRQATKTTATTVYVRDNVIVVVAVTRREIAKRIDRVIIIVVERKLVEDVLRLIRGGSETTSVVGIEIDRRKETRVVEGVTVEGATMTMMIHLSHLLHHRRHHLLNEGN